MHVRKARFEVHSYEVDAFDDLAAPALAGYLQELAGLQAAEMGCGIDHLMGRGLTWVLSRQRIEIDAPIRRGSVLEVATWPSGVERVFAAREFRVSVGGLPVARASTLWAVMDLARRRPVRPDRVLAPEFRVAEERLFPLADELGGDDPADGEQRFRIRYSDIDRNLHVTNSTYLAWALESVPQDTWHDRRVRSTDVHFLAECAYGSRVLSRVRALPGGAFAHSVLRDEDGKELARARTAWEPRT